MTTADRKADRHKDRYPGTRISLCVLCGALVFSRGPGRTRRFCNDLHKLQAWRAQRGTAGTT